MKGLPNCNVNINGVRGEIFVSDNDEGRFMCVFVKTPTADFCEIYKAYGFMFWPAYADGSDPRYFPIKLKEDTNLSEDVMREMWKQINSQFALIPE